METPVLFLSRYIIENKNPYYLGLKNVTEKGDWESWMLYMLEAVEKTAEKTILKIDAINKTMDRFLNVLKEKDSKIYSKDLMEVVFKAPYCNILSVKQHMSVSRHTAASYLMRLEKCGLVTKKKVGRETIYVNPSFIKALKKPL